jgi:ribonuclease VapC
LIVVDTSALFALLLRESPAAACEQILFQEDKILMSAGTLAEVMVVAAGRNVRQEMIALLGELTIEIVPVTPVVARRVGDAYARFGKGIHPARLNFGDCFAYEVAKTHDCPLLFVGDDFSRTDLKSALPDLRTN